LVQTRVKSLLADQHMLAWGELWQTESWSSAVVAFVQGSPGELVCSGEPGDVEVIPTPRSISHESRVTRWLSIPHVALPVTLWSLLLHSARTRASVARLPAKTTSASPSFAPLQDPTCVEHPTTHVPSPSTTCPWSTSEVLLEHGTRASIVKVVEATADTAARCWWSNHGTRSAAPSNGFRWGGDKRVAWFTMDSKVPPARGFSQVVYLEAEVVQVADFTGTRGGPKPCIVTWPFSHVSSATS
jgi:hypothetical protein